MSHDERMNYLRSLPGETISPLETSKVLGGMPYAYNLEAKKGNLKLPHIWRGNRLRIFKAPLLRLLEEGKEITI